MKILVLKYVLHSLLGIIYVIGVSAISPAAHAGLLMRFTGSVIDIYDPIGAFSGVASDDIVSGVVQYGDSNLLGDNDADFAQYLYSASPGGGNRMKATVGAYSLEATQRLFVQVYSPSYFATGVDFQFLDADTSALSTAGLPNGFQLSNSGVVVGLYTQSNRGATSFPTPPSSLLDLAQYDDPITGGFFYVDYRDSNGAFVDSSFVSFRLTSVQAVPEPSSLTICSIGLGMLALARRASVRKR